MLVVEAVGVARRGGRCGPCPLSGRRRRSTAGLDGGAGADPRAGVLCRLAGGVPPRTTRRRGDRAARLLRAARHLAADPFAAGGLGGCRRRGTLSCVGAVEYTTLRRAKNVRNIL